MSDLRLKMEKFKTSLITTLKLCETMGIMTFTSSIGNKSVMSTSNVSSSSFLSFICTFISFENRISSFTSEFIPFESVFRSLALSKRRNMDENVGRIRLIIFIVVMLLSVL